MCVCCVCKRNGNEGVSALQDSCFCKSLCSVDSTDSLIDWMWSVNGRVIMVLRILVWQSGV